MSSQLGAIKELSLTLNNKRKKIFKSLPALLRSSTKKFWFVFKSVSKHSNIANKMTWTCQDGVTTSANNPTSIANLLNHSHLYPAPCETSDINADWIKWKYLFLGAAVNISHRSVLKSVTLPYGSM
jgi:hypothetical protein